MSDTQDPKNDDIPVITGYVDIPEQLLSWTDSEDCNKMMDEKKGIDEDIVSIQVRKGDTVQFEINSRTETSMELMKNILHSLLDSKLDLLKYQQNVDRKDKQVGEKLKDLFEESFYVSEDLMGYVLGKKMANIIEVRKQTGAESIIVDDYMGVVRIIAKDKSICLKAKEKLQVVTKTVTFNEKLTGTLIGKGGSNVREYQDKSKVFNIQFDQGTVKLTGTKKSVAYAESLIQDAVQYYEAQYQLKNQEDEIYNRNLQYSTVNYNIENVSEDPYHYYDMYCRDGIILHQPEPDYRRRRPSSDRDSRPQEGGSGKLRQPNPRYRRDLRDGDIPDDGQDDGEDERDDDDYEEESKPAKKNGRGRKGSPARKNEIPPPPVRDEKPSQRGGTSRSRGKRGVASTRETYDKYTGEDSRHGDKDYTEDVRKGTPKKNNGGRDSRDDDKGYRGGDSRYQEQDDRRGAPKRNNAGRDRGGKAKQGRDSRNDDGYYDDKGYEDTRHDTNNRDHPASRGRRDNKQTLRDKKSSS